MQVKIDTNAKDVAKRIGKKGKALSASVKRALSITAQVGINTVSYTHLTLSTKRIV